jgi:hypothetical protein
MSCNQSGEENINIKIVNKFLKNMAKFKYLEMIVTYQNYNQKEISSRLNSRNACYN